MKIHGALAPKPINASTNDAIARMHLTLTPTEAGTRVRIDTDLTVLGKIGEFGQPIIRSKADTLLAEFARNLGSALAA